MVRTCAGRVAAPAGDVGVADSVRAHSGSTSMSGCFALTSAPLSGDDPDDAAGQVALDLVEQLHRLDQADDLADGDLAADLDVGRRAGRGRGVEDAGQRRLDRRRAWPPGRARRVDGSPVGRRRRPRRRRGRAATATGGRRRDARRACAGSTRCRPTRPRARLRSRRSSSVGQPVDQRQQLDVAARRRGSGGVRPAVRVVGHRRAVPSKTRAVFWPPNPNELLSAARIGRWRRRWASGRARRPRGRDRSG